MHPTGGEDGRSRRSGFGIVRSTERRYVHGGVMNANSSYRLLLLAAVATLVGCDRSPELIQIQPVRPVAELRQEALKATPPTPRGDERPSDLVEVVTLDPTIHLDIRYSTANNFLGVPVYSQARAFLQRPAAEALVRVNRTLAPQGYGLLIHDGYRPWYVTKIFWDATPPDQHDFVADPAKGSMHNRGCAVDLTLYDVKTDKAVEMPSLYDDATHAGRRRLHRRDRAAARAARFAASGHGGRRLHRRAAGVVALRLQGLGVVCGGERRLREPRALRRQNRIGEKETLRSTARSRLGWGRA